MKRKLNDEINGVNTSDGAGVKLTRVIGSNQLSMLDPFLLLDSFESDDAQDYIAGFPEHPHRGFETVTYILNGKMRHKDSQGHEGVIGPGGVQWMTAGKGILHSEMPEQENGLLQGFQLWVNLPASHKMTEPKYQEFEPESIPVERLSGGGNVKVISGSTNDGTTGPVINAHTSPTYMDITLKRGEQFTQAIPMTDSAFIYLVSGDIKIIEEQGESSLTGRKKLGRLSHGDELVLQGNSEESRLLFISGRPLNEPVVRAGPFVMNSKQEIMQAYSDFSNGSLG